MSWQRLAATVPILFIKIIPASGSTIILSYSQVDQDWSCQTVVNNFTSYAPYAQCYSIPPAGSVKVVQQDAYCPVTIYSDPYCSYNAEVAPLDACGSPYTVQSFTVDCQFPSITTNVPSTITASTTTVAQVPSPSPSRIPMLSEAPLPGTTSTTNTQPFLAQSSTEASVSITQTLAQSLGKSSILSLSTLIIGSVGSSSMSAPISTTLQTMNFNFTSSLAYSSTKSSATQSRSTAQAPFKPTSTVNSTIGISTDGDGNRGPNLSIMDQILLGTIFPAIGVLATVLFGINQWRRKEERKRKRRHDSWLNGHNVNHTNQPDAQSHTINNYSDRQSMRNDPVRRTQDGRTIMHVVLGHDRGPVACI